MAQFTPPPVSSFQGWQQPDTSFTPPPVSSFQGFGNQLTTPVDPQAQSSQVPQNSTVNPSDYDTRLYPAQEQAFLDWKARVAPNDSGNDYDFRGAFQAGVQPDPETGHWPDTFKKPNHPTFSDQSVYAASRPDLAGHWNGDQFSEPDPYGFQAAQAYGQQQGMSPEETAAIADTPAGQRLNEMVGALSKWSTEPIGGGAPLMSPQQPGEPGKNILRALYNPVASGYNTMLEPRNIGLLAATLFPPTSAAGLAGFAAEMAPSAVPMAKQAYEAGKQAVGIPVEHPMTGTEGLEAGTNLALFTAPFMHAALAPEPVVTPGSAAEAIQSRIKQEPQYAVQEPSAGEVFQRQPEEVGGAGGERGGMEQGEQGAVPTGEDISRQTEVRPFTEPNFARYQAPETTADLTRLMADRRQILMQEADQLGQQVQLSQAMGMRTHPYVEARLAEINDELANPITPEMFQSNFPPEAPRTGEPATTLVESPEPQTATSTQPNGETQPQPSVGTPVEPSGSEPETIGAANRVAAAREEAGLLGEEGAPESGVGIGYRDSVAEGNAAIDKGVDPYKVASQFQSNGLINRKRMGIMRAQLERLQMANARAHGALELDPQNPELLRRAQDAQDSENAFWKAYQPMKTEWSNIGTGMQEARGISDIDLQSQTTAEQAMREALGRELTASDKARAADAVKRTRDVNGQVDVAFDKAINEASTRARGLVRDVATLRRDLADKLKEITC